MRKSLPRWATAVFFAAFLLLGLLTAGDYGPTWDEQDEMDILRMNLWEYARVLGLDESAFERRAARGNELTISELVPIPQSIEQDHGIAAFYPLGAVVMSETLTGRQQSALWHMGCWALFTLGAFALYASCRELGLPRWAALLGPVFLLVSPRFFAQGHFNNKDIVLMALVGCMLWQALRLMRRPGFASGLCFAFFGALAANTKVAGAAAWGLCALFVLLAQLAGRRMTGRVWAVAGVTAVSFFGFYALLTPALWANPAGFVRYLMDNALAFQRWQNDVLFRGTVFHLRSENLPWYYLPYMIVATTPVWLLLLIALGMIGALLTKTNNRLQLWLPLVLCVLPLGFAVLARTHVYNGWRHFYFVYAPMLVLAAWGAWQLCRRWRRAAPAVLAVLIAVSGAGIAMEHPHQQAYYQPVVLLRGADYNELDYWNVSARKALEQLAQQETGEIILTWGDYWSEHAVRKALAAMPAEMAGRFVLAEDTADYVLSNPTYANFSGFEPEGDLRVELCSYGQPIMQIYETKGAGKQ